MGRSTSIRSGRYVAYTMRNETEEMDAARGTGAAVLDRFIREQVEWIRTAIAEGGYDDPHEFSDHVVWREGSSKAAAMIRIERDGTIAVDRYDGPGGIVTTRHELRPESKPRPKSKRRVAAEAK